MTLPAQISRSQSGAVVERITIEYPARSGAVLACQRAAQDKGIISILYHPSHERSEILRLEQAMQDRFGVKVLLVPGHPEMLQSTQQDRLKAIGEAVTLTLAEKAADHVARVLADAAAGAHAGEEYRIGVAWGRTMHRLARALRARPPGVCPLKLKVYPIVGIVQAAQTLPVQANMIASVTASGLGAESDQLPCPAIVTPEEEAIVNHHQVQAALTALEDLRLVLTGLGPIEDASGADDIMLSPDRVENARLYKSACDAGACGEICCWWFDRDGREVRTKYRSVGLQISGLQRTARDEDRKGRQVVIVVGGDRRRIVPLKAAILGRFVSVVITDTVTARALLGELA